jgi:hypothetical protein
MLRRSLGIVAVTRKNDEEANSKTEAPGDSHTMILSRKKAPAFDRRPVNQGWSYGKA